MGYSLYPSNVVPHGAVLVSALTVLSCLDLLECTAADTPRPNVILIITDYQGYGDLGAHGNTMIRTPHLDTLAKESVRLTNFHVDPTCAETRSKGYTDKMKQKEYQLKSAIKSKIIAMLEAKL